MILDQAKKLRLSGDAERIDLVEKQRAAVRHRDQSLLIGMSVGVGAAHVSKKLVVQQVIRNRRTIHHHHGPVAQSAQSVNGAGAHLFRFRFLR